MWSNECKAAHRFTGTQPKWALYIFCVSIAVKQLVLHQSIHEQQELLFNPTETENAHFNYDKMMSNLLPKPLTLKLYMLEFICLNLTDPSPNDPNIVKNFFNWVTTVADRRHPPISDRLTHRW